MSSTNKQNEIHRFMFRNLAVMGNLIVLNSAWQDIIKDRNYSNITKEILGGLTLFSVLFADKMKRDVVLNFQLKAISPVEFVRVEAIKEIAQSFNKEHSLFIRGMARSSKNSNENSNENNNNNANNNSTIIYTPPQWENVAYLHNPTPEYPEISQQRGEQGTVKIKAVISESGSVINAEIWQSSKFSRLDSKALETIKKWKFIPARSNQKNVQTEVIIPIRFILNNV